VIASEKSAEGIVGGQSTEGLNGRKREVVACLSLFAMRQNPVASGLLAKLMGEARRQCEPGTEANVATRAHETPAMCGHIAQSAEPPYADPHVRWCGRGGAAKLPPIPIQGDGVAASRRSGNCHTGIGRWRLGKAWARVYRLLGAMQEARKCRTIASVPWMTAALFSRAA
jgi:hypothetical protein